MKVKVAKCGGKTYRVEFSQGNQVFTLDYYAQEEEARWVAKMLRKAFKAYREEILDSYPHLG